MKKQAKITIERNGKSEGIPCYLQISQMFKRTGKNRWKARKTIKRDRKEFASAEIDKDAAHRDLNKQCHDFVLDGKRTESKRSNGPTVAEIVVAYLEAPPSCIIAWQGTRKTNLQALRTVTRGLVPGHDPIIKKQKDGSYKLVAGGFSLVWPNSLLPRLRRARSSSPSAISSRRRASSSRMRSIGTSSPRRRAASRTTSGSSRIRSMLINTRSRRG